MGNEFIMENINIAYRIANDFYKKCNLIEYDDLIQICLLGLTKAARTYKSEKSSFTTYAYNVIRNEIAMELRRINKGKNIYSLEEILPNTDNITIEDVLKSDYDIEEEFINKEERELLYKYIGELNGRERKILSLYLNGCNQTQISKELNMSQANISRILRKAIRKLRCKYIYQKN